MAEEAGKGPQPGFFAVATGSTSAPSRREVRNVPASWGRDELTQFLSILEDHTFASFVALPKQMDLIVEMDAAVCVPLGKVFHEPGVERVNASSLFIRGWSVYRAATRLALAGQLFETEVLLRSMVECSVYGWACWTDIELAAVWARRDENPESLRTTRKRFGWTALMEVLGRADAGLAQRVSNMYDLSIQQGAHPNRLGIALGTDHTEIGENRFVVSNNFSDGRPEAVAFGLLGVLRAGHLSYLLIEKCVPEKLRELGITERMNKLRQRLAEALRDQ